MTQINFDKIFKIFSNKLVFVIGNARGGSTFTNAIIGIHDEIFEIRWNAKKVNLKKNLSYNNWRKYFLRSPNYFNKEKIIKKHGLKVYDNLEKKIFEVYSTKKFRNYFLLSPIIYWLLNGNLDDLKKKYFCYKTNSWEEVYDVMENIPNTKIVVVQRNPLSVSLSMAKVYARKKKKKLTLENLLTGALSWNLNAIIFFKILMNFKKQSILIFYEKLVLEKSKEINKVFKFLKLKMISQNFFNVHTKNIFYKKTNISKVNTTKRKGVQIEGIERWKNELNKKQIKYIECLTLIGSSIFYNKINNFSTNFHNIFIILRTKSPFILLVKLFKQILIFYVNKIFYIK